MAQRSKPDPASLLANEFAQEKASALGRLGRNLETALAALCAFDSGPRDFSGAEARPAAVRAALVRRASVALWHFIVQREACGLRDMRHVLQDYRVPPEVAAGMGAQPPAPAASTGKARRYGNARG
jgi:hypothetical protein